MSNQHTAPRTLITGGFGFLATWVAAGLVRSGHRVILVDNREPEGTPAWLSGLLGDSAVETGRADITERGSLDRFGEADYVVHAAALLGVNKVRSAPRETLRVNIDGTAVALDYAARNPNVRRFLLLSTSEVYGSDAKGAEESEWLSVRSDDPRWSYAVSKVTAESMTAAWGTEDGLPFSIVRPFNVYGPLRTGAYAVGVLAAQAVAGEPITVHGDGSQSRAWCHAEDFAAGLIRCLHTPEANGEAFNIGDETNDVTVSELARLTRELSGTGTEIRHIPHTGPDIQSRKPDLTKARDLLGYRPVRDFEAGLRETIEWVRGGCGEIPLRLERTDWPQWTADTAGVRQP
ncbi:NAD-dependent epimerase/dehydratase family protein [Streptomyces sp. NBC_00306]|uniref:NAD-dependent epimerase/dehydratase family protein n=1 Tax=Streptomyces sp. NBC_00306 TaxID=2975708 RepID=UPI002E2A8032|nr:NAD-dependent epimerase/dehydratase family protein [Streptomyces sp. NBC_00306]